MMQQLSFSLSLQAGRDAQLKEGPSLHPYGYGREVKILSLAQTPGGGGEKNSEVSPINRAMLKVCHNLQCCIYHR